MSCEAHVKVWFDLAQPTGTAPTHAEEVARWLDRSVQDSRAFVLLLTKEAIASGWVRREIGFAKRMCDSHEGFRILVVKTDKVPVPKSIKAVSTIIDCDGIWWSRGISEELFGAVYSRQDRRVWITAGQPDTPAREGLVLRHGDLASEAGTVERFEWSSSAFEGSDFRRKDVKWTLAYRRVKGEISYVSGGGEREPADLEMHPGDRIAFINLHRRWGSDFRDGCPLWMRSSELTLTPDEVLDRYYQALEINYLFSASDTRQTPDEQPDTWRRVIAVIEVQSGDGEWRSDADVVWAMLRNGVTADRIAEQVYRRTRSQAS